MPLITTGILVARNSLRLHRGRARSIHPTPAGGVDINGDHECLSRLGQADDTNQVLIRARFNAGNHFAGVACDYVVSSLRHVPRVRLNVADRSHRARINTPTDNGVEVLSFRHVMEIREVHCQSSNGCRHRGKRKLLPKNHSGAVRFLVPAQWPQFEPYALQAAEVILERHARVQSAYARKFSRACNSVALRADAAYRIENLASPLIDFRDASCGAGRSIMSGRRRQWRVAGCRRRGRHQGSTCECAGS